MRRPRLEQLESLLLSDVVKPVLRAGDDLARLLQKCVRLVFLRFRFYPLLFRYPRERDRRGGQNQRENQQNVSDSGEIRPLSLLVLGQLERGFSLAQRLFALFLGRGHRSEPLALGAQPRLGLLFAGADEVKLQRGRRRGGLGPARDPGLRFGDIVA